MAPTHGTDPLPRRLRRGSRRVRPPRRRRSVGRRATRLGSHPRLPASPVVPRAGRRRSDGHRPARHGTRLARGTGADPPLARRSARDGWRDRVRRGHRPARTGRGCHAGGCGARLRRAGRLRGRAGRGGTRGPDGEPGAGARRAKVDGIKISLLDAEREMAMRVRLPAGVRMYTGDDFDYPRLILGDAQRHSDALLGIFDAIAPAASAALQALERGDTTAYRTALEPTVPLARHIFQTPTHAYKTGIVFLAYLNGHQRHFRMIGGAESWRSVPHLAELFRLADAAGLLADPDGAADRMRRVLALAGVE